MDCGLLGFGFFCRALSRQKKHYENLTRRKSSFYPAIWLQANLRLGGYVSCWGIRCACRWDPLRWFRFHHWDVQIICPSTPLDIHTLRTHISNGLWKKIN